MSNFVNRLDEKIFDAVLRAQDVVSALVPRTAIIETFLQTSFEELTPEQQVQIVETMGPEWYLRIAKRMEKRLREIDQSL